MALRLSFRGCFVESSLYVKRVVFEDGEIFPMLINRSTGIPLFNPTVYLISMKRSGGVAFATLDRDLRAIMFLYLWAAKHGIDIEERFREGNFLTLHEIDNIAQEVWSRTDCLLSNKPMLEASVSSSKRKVAKLSGYRVAAKKNESERVNSVTASVRLSYIRDYLDWLATQRVLKLSKRSADYVMLDSSRQLMRQALTARKASGSRRYGEDAGMFRLGLEHDVQKKLLEVIDPRSPENPWRNAHIRERNQLLILILLFLGVRRGEALGIRVSDMNFQKNEVTIHRTPDDALDPRPNKPQTKTRARRLGLSPDLARLCRDYIIKYRSKLKGARLHPYLFVETRQGKPLALNSLSDIFTTLREKVPDLPRNLSAHVLRYTWNDRFSEKADELIRKLVWTIEDEKKARNETMGWSPNSKMAELYSRRHIQAKARKVMVDLQNSILGIKDE